MARQLLLLAVALMIVSPAALAHDYDTIIANFRKATESQGFFEDAYGYAVFPQIGKAGFIVGGAFGRGRVYRGGVVTGDTSVTQMSVGFQLGGEVISEIIFFEDEQAYERFTSGNFEFSAQAQAVALVFSAQAKAGTTGASAGAMDKQFQGYYQRGLAVFTHVTGGLMYEASIAGQKFSFQAR